LLTLNQGSGEENLIIKPDDVECFFSILHDTVGADFTLKELCISFLIIIVNCKFQISFGWRKVTEEFKKQMDPDYPHTAIPPNIILSMKGEHQILVSSQTTLGAKGFQGTSCFDQITEFHSLYEVTLLSEKSFAVYLLTSHPTWFMQFMFTYAALPQFITIKIISKGIVISSTTADDYLPLIAIHIPAYQPGSLKSSEYLI